jgi:hypothetical protein
VLCFSIECGFGWYVFVGWCPSSCASVLCSLGAVAVSLSCRLNCLSGFLELLASSVLVGFRHRCVFVIMVVFYGVFRLAVRCFIVLLSCGLRCVFLLVFHCTVPVSLHLALPYSGTLTTNIPWTSSVTLLFHWTKFFPTSCCVPNTFLRSVTVISYPIHNYSSSTNHMSQVGNLRFLWMSVLICHSSCHWVRSSF